MKFFSTKNFEFEVVKYKKFFNRRARKFHFTNYKRKYKKVFNLRTIKKYFRSWSFLGKNIRNFFQGKILRLGL